MTNLKNIYSSGPIFLVFLCMGFGDVVGPLTGLLKQEFNLSNIVAQLIPFMGFLMFGLLSIPLGIVQDRTGKKRNLMIGLCMAFIGLGGPVLTGYSHFGSILISILLLGAGAAFLQVAGNPIMRDVSPEGKYSRNLSLAQFIKAIGSLSGSLIPLLAINYWSKDWKILFPVYSVIIFIVILLLWMTRINEKRPVSRNPATFRSCFSLLGNKFVLLMVLGIFLYVGAEVSMSSGLPIYLQETFNLDIAKLGLIGTLFFFMALTTGRFLGAVILNWINARKFLIISWIISITGIIGLFLGIKILAFISIFLIGLGFANIFPLIFSITIDAMPERSNELSGLMITAIVGGAIIPLMMGGVADLSNSLVAFIVPFLCIFYIGGISLLVLRTSIKSSQ